MDARERSSDGLHRLGHHGDGSRLGLELAQRGARVVERDLRVRNELRAVRAFDGVESTHRLGDRRREIQELRRDVRVGLQGTETAREVLPGGAGGRDGIGHGRQAPSGEPPTREQAITMLEHSLPEWNARTAHDASELRSLLPRESQIHHNIDLAELFLGHRLSSR